MGGNLVEASKNENFGFKIEVQSLDTVKIYINVKKDDYQILTSSLPIQISDEKSLIEYTSLYRLYYGIFYGAILALIFNSLFIYSAGRNALLLYYLFFIISALWYFIDKNSIGSLYIWKTAPYYYLNKFGNDLVFSKMLVVSSIIFCKEFLSIEKHFPWVGKVVNTLLYLQAIDYFRLLFGYNELFRVIENYFILIDARFPIQHKIQVR